MGVQIGHAGRQLGLPELTAVAPSAIAWGPGSRVPEELTQEGIAEIVEAFRSATVRAVEAGFDVIEVHAAHGYLLNEFLSPISNKRGKTTASASTTPPFSFASCAARASSAIA